VIPDPRPRANDSNMDYVCVGTSSLILKFCHWRRENYPVEVAPTFAPTEFCDILDALRLIDATANTRNRLLDTSWREFGQLLEPRFRLLQEAFNTEHFPDTKAKLASNRGANY